MLAMVIPLGTLGIELGSGQDSVISRRSRRS
jgi:hypothetical protein